MRAEVAFTFHFQPSEFASMRIEQLLEWRQQAARINKQVYGKQS
ncbi:GpE family phage tail protein [uncultured Kiloniella sp.]